MTKLNHGDDLQHLASPLHTRNANEIAITQIIGRPAERGHIGEYIASRIFEIALEQSAIHPGSDGRFKSGPLTGKSVNIKMYGKREGILDIKPECLPDYYLVLAGPKSPAMNSRGRPRPLVINEVFLFEAKPLIARLRVRGLNNIGIATSVRAVEWETARVYPVSSSSPLELTKAQQENIRLFKVPSTLF